MQWCDVDILCRCSVNDEYRESRKYVCHKELEIGGWSIAYSWRCEVEVAIIILWHYLASNGAFHVVERKTETSQNAAFICKLFNNDFERANFGSGRNSGRETPPHYTVTFRGAQMAGKFRVLNNFKGDGFANSFFCWSFFPSLTVSTLGKKNWYKEAQQWKTDDHTRWWVGVFWSAICDNTVAFTSAQTLFLELISKADRLSYCCTLLPTTMPPIVASVLLSLFLPVYTQYVMR